MKLYKYRPVSEFLYKELYYQEIYFASYDELNDPLDLSATIDYYPSKSEQLELLLYTIMKSDFEIENVSEEYKKNKLLTIKFWRDEERLKSFCMTLFNKLLNEKESPRKITLEEVLNAIKWTSGKESVDFKFDYDKIKQEINRLTLKFLKNSYVTCFSSRNENQLMWSHYASSHRGICLEFDLKNVEGFPYILEGQREKDSEKFIKRMSKWNTEQAIYWDRIKKVTYEKEHPHINFFEFAQVFNNEYDCDLIGLSKPWTHYFAHKLEMAFSQKLPTWEYEEEWRAIEINFDKPKIPEDRIRKYPIEALSGIYFGLKTADNIKNRIYKIIELKNNEVKFYQSKLNIKNELEFETWYYDE
tara:strand:- start:3332 stop:4405 length:1074 start_codon:yes stop_codon:yes gene_type:complete